MLFSGIGDIETAQETLSVGVGALAGSTIMLLTVPWGLSIYSGRVDIGDNGTPNYSKSPKICEKESLKAELNTTGVAITDAVSSGAKIMILTTFPYFLIQIPAMFIHGPSEDLAAGEKYWALAGLIVCLVGFVWYLYLQLQLSRAGQDKGKRVAVVKKLLQEGRVSLTGALSADVMAKEQELSRAGGYGAINSEESLYPDETVKAYLKDVLREAFLKYDANRNGTLDAKEVQTCEFAVDLAMSYYVLLCSYCVLPYLEKATEEY